MLSNPSDHHPEQDEPIPAQEPLPTSEKVQLQQGNGFLKADVFIREHNGKQVICKDYGRYAGSWLAWPARFLVKREARILEQLTDWPHSPKVVGLLGTLAMMMEFIPGEVLRKR